MFSPRYPVPICIARNVFFFYCYCYCYYFGRGNITIIAYIHTYIHTYIHIYIELRKDQRERLVFQPPSGADLVEIVEILSRSPHNRYIIKHNNPLSRIVLLLNGITFSINLLLNNKYISETPATPSEISDFTEKLLDYVKVPLLLSSCTMLLLTY